MRADMRAKIVRRADQLRWWQSTLDRLASVWPREERVRLSKCWLGWRRVIRDQRARLVTSWHGWQRVVLIARLMPTPLAYLKRTRI